MGVPFSVDWTGLVPGPYTHAVQISSNDGSAQVAEGTDHTYTAAGTTAVVLTPDVSPYESGPDVFIQCGSGEAQKKAGF